MGVSPYQKEVAPGKIKTFYLVVAEAINRYTGKRVQKKRRGISSEPKALHIYKELWSMCREERPDGINFTHWGKVTASYLQYLDQNLRSAANPEGFSPHLVRNKKSRLSHTDSWADTYLKLVTPQFVIKKLNEMECNGTSRSVTNHILKEVKCVFTYALHNGAIVSNPFSGFKMRKMPKKRKQGLSHEEVKILLCEAKKRNHPYYYIWLLTIALGLRRSELAGLKWIDLNLEQGLIYLERQLIPGEGIVDSLKDEDRVVAIPQQITPVLKEMKLKAKTEFVIEVDCKQWQRGEQAKVLRAFCSEIGIKEICHHKLRSTHITLAIRDGISLATVKDNVGHAKLSTTDQYYFSSGVGMIGSMDKLNVHVPQDGNAEVIPIKRS